MSSGKWRPFCLGLNVLQLRDAEMHVNCVITISLSNGLLPHGHQAITQTDTDLFQTE